MFIELLGDVVMYFIVVNFLFNVNLFGIEI